MAHRGKGGKYERAICKEFSMWWTNGKDDSCFWRSSTSGGRATVRSKTGRKTRGHYGDMAATSRLGCELIDVCVAEIKCGYSRRTSSIGDVLDAPLVGAPQLWEEWFWQASVAWRASGSFAWLLIQKRDGRQPLLFMPSFLYKQLRKVGAFADVPSPLLKYSGQFRRRIDLGNKKFREEKVSGTIIGMRLEAFFLGVTPNQVIGMSKHV